MMTTAESKSRETKECGLCKCTIERGTLDNYHWNRMRYCSKRCSALYRGVLIGGWRHDKKECKVCGALFSPRPGISKGCWRRLKCCSEECARKAQTGRKAVNDPKTPAYRFQRVEINPADCKEPGQRLRFLRLSRSPEGGKIPIGFEDIARTARLGNSTLAKIESCDPTVPPKCIKKLCDALKIPLDMLDWPDKKWVRVVTRIGLTATELKKTENQ